MSGRSITHRGIERDHWTCGWHPIVASAAFGTQRATTPRLLWVVGNNLVRWCVTVVLPGRRSRGRQGLWKDRSGGAEPRAVANLEDQHATAEDGSRTAGREGGIPGEVPVTEEEREGFERGFREMQEESLGGAFKTAWSQASHPLQDQRETSLASLAVARYSFSFFHWGGRTDGTEGAADEEDPGKALAKKKEWWTDATGDRATHPPPQTSSDSTPMDQPEDLNTEGPEDSPLLPSAPPLVPELQSRPGQVALLGTAFLLIFSAFTVITTLTSSVLPKGLGFPALATIYIGLSLSNLVASSVVARLGVKLSLIVGALTYILLDLAYIGCFAVAGHATLQYLILLPAAALLGFGAAILWAAQGAYVKLSSSDANVGFHSGLFFGIFLFNSVLGPIGAAQLYKANIDQSIIFTILTVVACTGVLLLLVLKKEPRDPEAEARRKTSMKGNTLCFFRFIRGRKPMLLVPLFYASGLGQAFMASLPLFIDASRPNSDAEKLYLGATLGICNALVSTSARRAKLYGSIGFGRLGDIFGPRAILVLDTVNLSVAMGVLTFFDVQNRVSLLIPVACALGFSDAILSTQAYTLIAKSFPPRDSVSGFAAFKFHQALASGAALALSSSVLLIPRESAAEVPNMPVWFALSVVAIVAGVGLAWGVEVAGVEDSGEEGERHES
ncbi:major facilitator superfamily domain-containing protein [Blyttiomyces helicus]|uniref:Major facilitator superfamily domain-containing protein n=1 Tax=Blyttiomyces helicus TaxID=388810 RepID=A0A4P9WCJ6_9FUNG|nr:major facilitator superfamily domain-containing protein [Blyttiomyces helicus]|eukprot:RKO90234.1 major facilitator superfamily domain-containing protein [Blyttiomyces helicus]